MAKRILKLSQIRLDGNTQPRVELDEGLIVEYKEAYQSKAEMPPLEVMFDGASYWLWDGFHRRWGAERAGLEKLPCNVTNGTREDAQWASYGANKSHGLRRFNCDKQKAVKAALRHPNGPKMSDRQIAEHCGVGSTMVLKYRSELTATAQIEQSPQRTGRDGRTINTANIGKPRSPVHHPVADDSDDDQDTSGGAAPVSSGPLAGMDPDPAGADSDGPQDRIAWMLEQLDLLWADYQATFHADADWMHWRMAQEAFAVKMGHD